MTKASGSFELTSWDEEQYEELDSGAKLTRASVTQTFTGAIEGDGAVQWLMSYRPDGTAHFVGLQRVRGTIEDRKGVFVLETIGDFDGKAANWGAQVVRGSASGDLEGLTGSATFGAPHGSKASFDFEYEFE